jgi:tetratricopeptide (TPR) repeat protein
MPRKSSVDYFSHSLWLLLNVVSAATLLISTSVMAKAEDEVDHLKLASMLVSNGHYARADAELSKVPKEQQKEDSIAFHTTRGLIELNAKQYLKAQKVFVKALKSVKTSRGLKGKDRKEKLKALKLYMLQCSFGQKNYQSVVSQIEANPGVLKKNLAWSLKVASLWNLGQKAKAWQTLNKAAIKFPKDTSFQLQKVNYLLELDLRNEALLEAKAAVNERDLSATDLLKLGGQFKARKQLDSALWFFEYGVLKYPSAELLTVELAHTYTLKGWNLAAANIFEKLALRKPKYYGDVSELYRQQGKLIRAEYFNGLVEDQQKKFRQRFSLALGQQNFARALSMQPTLSRLGLLEDQNLIYALAFTQYQMGSLNPAKQTLAKITDAKLFEKVVALQSTIKECEAKPWECE